jgi:hypothetical protein
VAVLVSPSRVLAARCYADPVRTGFAWLAVLNVGVAVATVSSSPVVTAQATGPASWRIVTTVQHCGPGDELLSVTATGPRDAWALGMPGLSIGGSSCADLEHWDGNRWRHIPLPHGVSPGGTLSPPVAASSPRDAWIFPAVPSARFCSHNDALRWDGRAWHKSHFPAKMTVRTAVAFSRKDVWALGQPVPSVDDLIRYAARYDGRAWHRVRLPGPAFAIGALSKRDLWAIGPTTRSAARPLARENIIAMHWTGRAWHTIGVPKISVRTNQNDPDAALLTVAGPDDVWWSYQVSHGQRASVGLLRWDGASWRHIGLPDPIDGIDAMTQDGHGGLWLLAGTNIDSLDLSQHWYHYGAGRWARQAVRSPRGYSMMRLSAMTWIPRSTDLWAVGGAFLKHGLVAVIARYGPRNRP